MMVSRKISQNNLEEVGFLFETRAVIKRESDRLTAVEEYHALLPLTGTGQCSTGSINGLMN